jgi:hypothetical protein
MICPFMKKPTAVHKKEGKLTTNLDLGEHWRVEAVLFPFKDQCLAQRDVFSGFHDLKALLTLALAAKNGSPNRRCGLNGKAPIQGYAVPILIDQERLPPA